MSGLDKYRFKNHHIAVAEVDVMDRKIVLKYFLLLNRTGKVMDSEHLQIVEKMLGDGELSQTFTVCGFTTDNL